MAIAFDELLLVIAHTFTIYLFLIVCLAFLGRREIAQLTFVELAVLMILGSAVETAMVAGNTSLLVGLASAATLLATNFLLGRLVRRWAWLRGWLIGGPVILVQDGRILVRNIHAAGLTVPDVLEGIRERGYAGPDELRYAVLEVDGTIGMVPTGRLAECRRPMIRRNPRPEPKD